MKNLFRKRIIFAAKRPIRTVFQYNFTIKPVIIMCCIPRSTRTLPRKSTDFKKSLFEIRPLIGLIKPQIEEQFLRR